MKPSATTLAQLKASGWKSRSVKDEIRENTVRAIRAGESLVAGILGYDDTVLPQVQNALLAGLLRAPGDVVISLDADLQDDLEAIPRMLDAHAAGAEIEASHALERRVRRLVRDEQEAPAPLAVGPMAALFALTSTCVAVLASPRALESVFDVFEALVALGR